ncbi:hypothetical protein [Brevundimonas sp.]|uniref:hypothetical protein n=1 Tax=Brevundimonas sp. TaxID=1871086 RepID=UPI003BACC5D2
MTTADHTTDRAAWQGALASHEAAVAALDEGSRPEVDDDPTEVLYEAEGAAWLNVLHTPAPDIGALAHKLRMALTAYHDADEPDGDDLALMQSLLDSRAQDGGALLVRAWQDALRLAGVEHPIVSMPRSLDKPWPVFAADYRQALATLQDMPGDTDAFDSAASRHTTLYYALLAYPVSTVEDLAEKGDLIALDCQDGTQAMRALNADARRIAEAAK